MHYRVLRIVVGRTQDYQATGQAWVYLIIGCMLSQTAGGLSACSPPSDAFGVTSKMERSVLVCWQELLVKALLPSLSPSHLRGVATQSAGAMDSGYEI
jgi:hypothetical protein